MLEKVISVPAQVVRGMAPTDFLKKAAALSKNEKDQKVAAVMQAASNTSIPAAKRAVMETNEPKDPVSVQELQRIRQARPDTTVYGRGGRLCT